MGQYILCQQESIPSLACWLFTSGWNQAEFGQYYLYDNLLNSEEGGVLDGDLLPILVLSGGLTAEGCKPISSKTRRSDSPPACPKGEVLTPSGCKRHPTSRKRRSDCNEDDTAEECSRKCRSPDCNEDDTDEECIRKRRSPVCDENESDEECSRKRRSPVCDKDDTDEECRRKHRSPVCDKDDSDEECNRKRRSSDCDKDDSAADCNRKRRSVCDGDQVWTAEGCVAKSSRKRRSSDPPKCNDDEVLAPS